MSTVLPPLKFARPQTSTSTPLVSSQKASAANNRPAAASRRFEECPDCGDHNLVRASGCCVCLGCHWTACGRMWTHCLSLTSSSPTKTNGLLSSSNGH